MICQDLTNCMHDGARHDVGDAQLGDFAAEDIAYHPTKIY